MAIAITKARIPVKIDHFGRRRVILGPEADVEEFVCRLRRTGSLLVAVPFIIATVVSEATSTPPVGPDSMRSKLFMRPSLNGPA
jgi:hypothetical protein